MVAQQRFNGDAIVVTQNIICSILEQKLKQQMVYRSEITKFHSACVSPISITNYIARVAKLGSCLVDHITLALFYVNRATECDPNLIIDQFTIHRLMITAIVIATKYDSDVYYKNSAYAKIGGLPVDELNSLEVAFLSSINYNLYVSPIEFKDFERSLLSQYTIILSESDQNGRRNSYHPYCQTRPHKFKYAPSVRPVNVQPMYPHIPFSF